MGIFAAGMAYTLLLDAMHASAFENQKRWSLRLPRIGAGCIMAYMSGKGAFWVHFDNKLAVDVARIHQNELLQNSEKLKELLKQYAIKY